MYQTEDRCITHRQRRFLSRTPSPASRFCFWHKTNTQHFPEAQTHLPAATYSPQPSQQAHDTTSHKDAGSAPHHDTGEVDSSHAVQDEEEGGICEGAKAGDEAQGGQQHQDVHICEVGVPGGGLVLTHTGDDGNVLGGIGWIQQTQAPPCIPVCVACILEDSSFDWYSFLHMWFPFVK